ncbi:UDP-N-acetylmuramoyl-L-alanyl-D-glutamate--2,6-diaminopimelate ligase (plasmid) [Ureibacillus chungkukjangi]|uniref:UDP-N-acetylmuramoyl-L-alanyl-D-glutamate--2, 6-diaminopimelate ligase n=1 Tax=Ureibacillus chungkukjangi TaxID=1202712 RepID=UPI00203A5C68|nr:UDP-N-acetylmuramoyl-L-alanyl-D-glutamate--2,6-diaminopimelate ligase [Ureibacillus chungkukjangi]MCM3389342.1 UDP-N-acetylmuramoyl-L-alanyl-D-glutamate--2,6-diaminopimelate ligase [Ureibacillus chungkukjangi]
MKLKQLINTLDLKNTLKSESANINISGIADNSIDVENNYIFVAIKGLNTDGHDYISDAIKRGASAIIGEIDIEKNSLPVPYIQVSNSRKALGVIANSFYNSPSKQKLMIGITGTNGKTTTSFILKHILESNGMTCSLIGTIQNEINGEVYHSKQTTPSSLSLQRFLSESRDEIAIVEVSSHGLTQYRVEGIRFDICIFTNLEQEHLDYHGTMENYFKSKLLLFNHLKENGQAVVNVDNFWGEKLAEILKEKEIIVHTIGQARENEVQIKKFNYEKSVISIEESNETIHFSMPMTGVHNLYNFVMAYRVAQLLGIQKEDVINSLRNFKGVKGRFEILKLQNDVTVVVDYAHTANAVFYCLNTAKQHGAKRVTHIFGFRGNRDESKRKEMITISSELSNQFILTFDDLNSVTIPEMIQTLKDLNNLYGNQKGLVIPDRTLAIKWAIEQSKPVDWIIITGKGHEDYNQKFTLPTSSDEKTVLYLTEEFNKTNIETIN